MPDDDKSVVTAANETDENRSTDAASSHIRTVEQQRELEELQAELRYLRNAALRSQVTRSYPAGEARSARDEVEYQIRLQPFKAVAVAAFVGFVYGIAL